MFYEIKVAYYKQQFMKVLMSIIPMKTVNMPIIEDIGSQMF